MSLSLSLSLSLTTVLSPFRPPPVAATHTRNIVVPLRASISVVDLSRAKVGLTGATDKTWPDRLSHVAKACTEQDRAEAASSPDPDKGERAYISMHLLYIENGAEALGEGAGCGGAMIRSRGNY